MKRIGLLLIFFISLHFSCAQIYVYADATSNIQSQIDANNQQINSLRSGNCRIPKTTKALGTEKNTLQSTISSLTLSQKQLATQIQMTQNKIASANLQIQQLTLSIGDKETAISADQDAISKALRNVDEGEQTPLIIGLISSNSLE